MSRITITRRHTGRFYIGLDTQGFAALYGSVVLAHNTRATICKRKPTAAEDQLLRALNAFIEKARVEATLQKAL